MFLPRFMDPPELKLELLLPSSQTGSRDMSKTIVPTYSYTSRLIRQDVGAPQVSRPGERQDEKGSHDHTCRARAGNRLTVFVEAFIFTAELSFTSPPRLSIGTNEQPKEANLNLAEPMFMLQVLRAVLRDYGKSTAKKKVLRECCVSAMLCTPFIAP